MRWPTEEEERSIVMRYITRTCCCESIWRYLPVLDAHLFIFSFTTVVLNTWV